MGVNLYLGRAIGVFKSLCRGTHLDRKHICFVELPSGANQSCDNDC